jgi:hypothetical protein
MTLEKEATFFSKWTQEQQESLVDFNARYERGEEGLSRHPLINPSPARR